MGNEEGAGRRRVGTGGLVTVEPSCTPPRHRCRRFLCRSPLNHNACKISSRLSPRALPSDSLVPSHLVILTNALLEPRDERVFDVERLELGQRSLLRRG